MPKSCNYNPMPTRVWSRVQNPCTFIVSSSTNSVFSPLTNEVMTAAQAMYLDKQMYKGNILQYKNNSSRLTKNQYISQISKGISSTRKQSYATQSQTYTNPNTTSLQRVNYNEIPFPNDIVGQPNNISGPYQYGIPNPFDCSSNVLVDGGSLVCNAYVDPCTGEVSKSVYQQQCFPTSCSDVPGPIQGLCWNPKLQTWFPRQRYTMNNSGNKWPQGYKGITSSMVPEPPIFSIVSTGNGTAEISWIYNDSPQYPVTGFKVYAQIDGVLVLLATITDPTLRTTVLTGLPTVTKGLAIIVPKMNKTIVSKPVDPLAGLTIIMTAIFGNTESPISNNGIYKPAADGTDGTGGIGCTVSFYNNLFKDNTIIEINTLLLKYLDPNSTGLTQITVEKYNALLVNLAQLSKSIAPTCGFYNIIEIFKDILISLKHAFDCSVNLNTEIINSATWHNDSIILHSKTKLEEYINNLISKKSILPEITGQAISVELKPQYVKYHELYGIPVNLDYDWIKLNEIERSLNLI